MRRLIYSSLALSLTASVTAQAIGSVCGWLQPRAGVVGDTIYFDGGEFYEAVSDGFCQANPVYQTHFNFSTSFNSSSNFTDLFPFTNVTSGNPYDPHVSGFMFADNYQWYSFGGMSSSFIDNITQNTEIIWDGIYREDPSANLQSTTPIANYQPYTTDNFTHKYVTNGGGVNAPSEQLGFYFGGLATPGNTDISWITDTKIGLPDFPSQLVNTMLIVDTSDYQHANWNQTNLPSGVARSEAMLAWVPIGEHGAVFVMGGALYPADIFGDAVTCNISSNYTKLNSQAQSYMTNISVYDVGSGNWYSQTTNGATPPQLAQACAVVASGPDNSTHHIYVYGGYAAAANGSTASDDVWILSVPAFTWYQVKSSNSAHGRTGHVCAKPYPDQMMVIGGTATCRSQLDDSAPFADVFNLVSLNWTGKYDPTIWSNYTVPSQVKRAIATPTAANMNSNLKALFQTSYPGKEPQYYPYPVTAANGSVITPTAQPTPTGSSGSSGSTDSGSKHRNRWLIPVAVVVPIVGVILIALALLFCIRRRRKDSSESSKHSRIVSWIIGQKGGKSLGSDDDTTQVESTVGPHEAVGDTYYKNGRNGQVAELHSHSIPAELPAEAVPYATSPEMRVRDHPLYPHDIDGRASTNKTESISSPTIDSATPVKEPKKTTARKKPPFAPDDMILDKVEPRSPQIVASSPHAHPLGITNATTHDGDVSPEMGPVHDDSFPNDPPTRLLSNEATTGGAVDSTQRPMHKRNTSSVSDVSNMSPVAERTQHQSMISPIADTPTTAHTASPSSPTPGSRIPQVRRKEVGSLPSTPVAE